MSDQRAVRLRPFAVRIVELLLVAAAIALLAWVAVRLRLVVLPVILAIFLSVFLVPVARVLRRVGLPGALATLLAMGGSVAIIGLLVWLIAPPVVDQATDLQDQVAAGIDEVLRAFDITDNEADRYLDQALDRLRENSSSLSQGLISGALILGEVIAGLLVAIVLVFFFVNDGGHIWRWIVERAPAARREDVDTIGRRAWRTVGGYLRGVAIIALVDAVLIGLLLLVLGVPLVLPLAVLTFFGAFFPIVGATVAGAAAALVALVTEGTVDAVIVVAAILVIQELEGDVLYPLIVGRSIKLHPVAILLLLTAGGATAGIIGALLAIPFGAVVWEAVRYVRGKAPPSGELAT